MKTTTKDEWLDRYANRIREISGWTADEARKIAENAAGCIEYEAEHESTPVVWEDPETLADEELSYWEADE